MISTNPTWRPLGLSFWLLPSATRTALSLAYQGLLLGCVLIVLGEMHCGAAERPEVKTASTPPNSRLIQGKVTAIVDGDTLHLATDDANYAVDLAGIDAPEKGQPSGNMAAQVLYLRLLQKEVQVLVLAAPSANPIVAPVVPKPTTAPPIVRVCGMIMCRQSIIAISNIIRRNSAAASPSTVHPKRHKPMMTQAEPAASTNRYRMEMGS